jgi:hypothetical protein
MSTVSHESSAAAGLAHDELGPIDLVLFAYPPGAPLTGEAADHLIDLVEQGIIRVLDVMFVQKNEDGTFSGFEAKDLNEDSVGDFSVFDGASSGLLGDADAAMAADSIDPGVAAVMILYENKWAAPFAAAVRRNGGVLIDNQRIPHQDVIEALEAIDAAS